MKKIHRWRNLSIFGVVLLLLVTSASIAGAARILSDQIIHPRRLPVTISPADMGIVNWETITLTASDGLRLSGWFIPAENESPAPTILFLHGLGGNRQTLLEQAVLLHHYGYAALLIDLRGHGESEGAVTTLGYLELQDVQAALDLLLARPDVNPEQIALIGESMGAVTAIRAAARIPQVRAVVAQSAFTSAEDIMAEILDRHLGLPPFPLIPLGLWLAEQDTGVPLRDVRPVDDIGRIAPRPVLLMHGTQDQTIDPVNSQELYDAAHDPRDLVYFADAQHGGLLEADPELWENHVVGFLEQYVMNP